ncbi:unnamed protein product [Cuscuta epithymum]|uniref:Retrotransposon gag domain-containing protein n=1 Tax=Cuscuta epithymum TaxID=186058 RepID=A0AAV0CTE8_9ASTE|nr:unnamed protein product [Cuscuta epithymum]
MEGANQLLIEFHEQLEMVRDEIRREMAEKMAHLQRENDMLRSQVQLAVSIASKSRLNRRSDTMTAATRLDICFSPAATDPPATVTDPVSLTLEPSIPHYRSRTYGEPGPSSFMQYARRNEPSVSFLEPLTERFGRPVTTSASTLPERRPEVNFIPSPTRPEVIHMVGPTSSIPIPIHPAVADQMSMLMEQVRHMQDKINGLLGVPPPLERASRTCYEDSPFDASIIRVQLPNKFDVPIMEPFDGTTDPGEHVARYKQVMSTVSVRPGQREACMCRGFGITLIGPDLTWFVNLLNGSVGSFAELVNLFNRQFASSKVLERRTSDLYQVTQRHGESLRDYLHRFNVRKVLIPKCDVSTVIEAFRKGLYEDSELYRELTKYPCRSFEDVQTKALAFIRLEEDLRSRLGHVEHEWGHIIR